VGMYEPVTGERLPIVEGPGSRERWISLGRVEVRSE